MESYGVSTHMQRDRSREVATCVGSGQCCTCHRTGQGVRSEAVRGQPGRGLLVPWLPAKNGRAGLATGSVLCGWECAGARVARE